MIDNMADNAYTAEAVAAEDTGAVDAVEDAGAAAGESTTEAAEGQETAAQEHEQDITRTQAFAQRLKERTDREIAAAGITNIYTGERIRNAADLRAFRRMQDAEAAGRDPESIAGEAALLEQLGEYKLREQEAAILADPDLSEYYDEYRDDVLAIAESARSSGSDVDLKLALRIVMAHNYEDIRRRDAERVREEVTKNYDAKRKASPGSVGGGGTSLAPDFTRMSDEDFEKYLSDVKQGRRRVGQ